MPFGPLPQPSIGLGLLAAAVDSHTVRTEYLTIAFADLVGAELYRWINLESPNEWLLGEWIFAAALHDEPEGHEARFEAAILAEAEGSAVSAARRRQIAEARRLAPTFIADCTRRLLELGPKIVGFSNSYAQQVASLALARSLKQAAPDLIVVFGGANCEGEMGRELFACFDQVDVVVSGEGDGVFPELIDRLLRGHSVAHLPGVLSAADPTPRKGSHAPAIRRMDRLPIPDYRDFFDQWYASETGARSSPVVLFETSRGCWWGERSHCTFCGLNGATMRFRSKSAQRVLDELGTLADLYPGHFLMSVDNILDFRYFRDLIPQLASSGKRFDLFFALKANLEKDQLRALYDAGVRKIQPGIESLSSEVLRLMRKGETALQNLEVLKWCREIGLQPLWNLLWGFPGEPPEAYRRMAELVPRLSHLTPPQSAQFIRLDRFSPGYDQGPELGFHNIRPCDAYAFVYP
ncbi:MAG: RiPP maturation radical SAM C-methyltransferase, partial [Holophagales bacterium]|nr:RiPP maturation radical SAM C-methyltransferase [Holophagales bacterium]